jgi:Na+/melibiose symporter-like transporter
MYIGMMLMQSSMAYYFTYVLGDFLLMSVSMTATTSFAVVASIIGPKIGVKLGKKNAMVVGLLINTASLLSITFLAKESLIIYIILSCINSLGMYTFTGFGPNYVIDAGEYHYYKTGVDNRALAMGMMNMPIKIGFIIGGTLAGYALQAIGYTAGMTVTPEFVSKFMWVFTGIPSAFYLLGAIIMFLGYKITDEDAAMYAKANAERMAKLAQQT